MQWSNETFGWRCAWLGKALAFISLLFAARVLAVPVPSAPPVSNGTYTVSYSACSGCVEHWLEERRSDGIWRVAGRGAVSFTNQPNGTYHYRAAYWYEYSQDYYDFYYYAWTDYSAEITVTVAANAPPVDTLETQLTYQYETRYGDGDGDGRLDLLLSRIAGGMPGNGALDTVLLVQGGSGQFSARVPSATQAAVARGWPRAALQVVLRDFNVDGFADVLLKGVAGVINVGGVLNQIVYAPARVLTQQPLGVRAVDQKLKRFAADARDYLADSSYFTHNAPVQLAYQPVYFYYCSWGYDFDYWTGSSCGWYTTWIPTIIPDYSSFSGEALNAWTLENSIQNGTVSAAQGIAAIQSSFEQALGAPIGGRDLRGLAGEQGAFDDATYRRGFELFLAVLGIFDANAQELEPARESGRRSDVVYVTGRRVLGFLPLHTALEYSGSTLSAFDSNSSLLGDGVLVSQPNWPSDHPTLTMTLGTVSSTLGPALYWAQLRAADANYDDDLPYDAVPSIGKAGYNSNGYSHGLVRATAGVPNIDMNRFVGGEKPVPPHVFH